jgi:hypothetical protein
MKLYMHPASTASRPVMLFADENCQSLKGKEFVRR